MHSNDKCDLSMWPQHPLCVRSRSPPVRPGRPTGSPHGPNSSARPGGRVLCRRVRSRPVPTHWGRNHSPAGRTPRWHPSGPSRRHTLFPVRRLSTAPRVQHSGRAQQPATQPGGLHGDNIIYLLHVAVRHGSVNTGDVVSVIMSKM